MKIAVNMPKKKTLIIILLSYLLILIYWMLFGFGRVKSSEYMYNLIPFKTITIFLQTQSANFISRLINLIGNIGVFIPFGILLPMIFKKSKFGLLIIFETGLFTLEILQLITRRGKFDIDDFILNTIGAIIGYGVYNVFRSNLVRR